MAVLSRRASTAPARRATRDAIAQAAVALLEEGAAFADLSIEQIVRRAGLSRPTFYAHFDDKRALILHLGAALQQDVEAAADPWLQRGEGERRATLAAVLEAFRAHRAVVAAIVEAAGYDSEVHAFWHAFHDQFRVRATARIREVDPGLPDARVHARAFALIWMTERCLTEHLARPDVDEDALLDELAGLWGAGP